MNAAAMATKKGGGGRKKKRAQAAGAKASASSAPTVTTSSDGATSQELPAEFEAIEAIEIDLTSFDDGDPASNRRSERIPMSEKVAIRGFFGGGEGEHRLVNASLHGVFVETAMLLDVGDPVELALPLDDGKTLKLNGRVRWVTPFGGLKDARPGMGIELVGVEGEKKDALSALLYRRSRA